MACNHTVTQGREGHRGSSWCVACGEKVSEVDSRECQGCGFSRKLLTGWVCKKHLMAISPDMHVTFNISEGTCWEASSEQVSV